MKNNKGITLIALTVTIIVLLIIASVGTYSGVEALRNANEEAQVTELNMLQQAVVENYTKYLATKDSQYIRGTKVGYTDIKRIINDMNSQENVTKTVTLKKGNYAADDDISQYYYRLTKRDCENMGLEQVKDTYIINYSTGEIINSKKLVTKSGTPLYIYSTEAEEKENYVQISPDGTEGDEAITPSQTISVKVKGLTDVKYTWTNILQEPKTEEFTKRYTSVIEYPENLKMQAKMYYLWVYGKNSEGKEIIVPSKGFLIKQE